MQKLILALITLSLTMGLALAQEDAAPADQTEVAGAAAPATPARTLQDLLAQGIEDVPTVDVLAAFEGLRESIAADPELEVVAVAIEDVEAAFTAEPFDRTALVTAMEELALQMRIAAEPGDETLTVELASLVDQTAAYIEGEGWTPRLEVNVP